MQDLEKMQAWLCTYPQWQGAVSVDYVDSKPGSFGLYFQGLEVLKRRQDVLGNREEDCRYTFLLRFVAAGQDDAREQAQWLLQFQSWVQTQNALGNTPGFGDVPEKESIRAEKGRLEKASQVACGLYTVTITAEFTKKI